MNARHTYLFTLALTLPLASCHFVGPRPDFGVVEDSFSPAENDSVNVESQPTASIPLPAGYQPTALPPAPEPPARAAADADFRTPSLPGFSQQQPQPAPRSAPTPTRHQSGASLFSQPAPAAAKAPHAATTGVTYTVRSGDTLSHIARAHNVSLTSLAAANGLTGQADHIRSGQQLLIPQSGASVVPPPLPSTPPATAPATPSAPATATPAPGTTRQYRVRPGDTLYHIARQHGINYHELMRVNNLDETSARSLRDGTLLTIPAQP